MSTQTDLILPLSALQFEGDHMARAIAADWDTIQIGVLLQSVIQTQAESLLEAGTLHTVSVTFDVSAEAANGTEVRFESRIDRKTRTLIFASGLARQDDTPLLKATVVYRIS